MALLLVACRVPPGDSGGPGPGDSGDSGDTGGDTGEQVAFLPANDRAYESAAHGMIAAAGTRVRLVMYLVQPVSPVTDLLDDLERAAARGVDVRVLLDDAGPDVATVYGQLTGAGVEVALDSPQVTTHAKLLVVDDRALLGSHNWTAPALERNNEAALEVRSSVLAAAWADWADALWADSTSDPVLPDLEVGGAVPLAHPQVVDALAGCLAGATERVDLAIYAIAWDAGFPEGSVGRLLDGVEAAQDRGATVRVLLDRSPWIDDNGINDDAAARLLAAGVAVRHTPSDEVTHAKVLQCDDTVIVSDANWSHSSLDLYNGTSVSLTSAPLAATYTAWFESAWNDAAAWTP